MSRARDWNSKFDADGRSREPDQSFSDPVVQCANAAPSCDSIRLCRRYMGPSQHDSPGVRRQPMHSHSLDRWTHDHLFLGAKHARNERRTWFVVVLTAVMMVGEIVAGTLFGSMALLA